MNQEIESSSSWEASSSEWKKAVYEFREMLIGLYKKHMRELVYYRGVPRSISSDSNKLEEYFKNKTKTELNCLVDYIEISAKLYKEFEQVEVDGDTLWSKQDLKQNVTTLLNERNFVCYLRYLINEKLRPAYESMTPEQIAELEDVTELFKDTTLLTIPYVEDTTYNIPLEQDNAWEQDLELKPCKNVIKEDDKPTHGRGFTSSGLKEPFYDHEEVQAVVAEGKKYDTNKNRWDLLPIEHVESVVRVLTMGATKYGDNNWQLVENAQERYYAAAMRHLVEWRKGNKIDNESGESHLAHVMCNLVFLMHFDKKSDE
jgi:hypothetical protein